MTSTFLNTGLTRHSLVEKPWRLQPVPQFRADYHDPGFDDSGWLEHKLPGQWQMLPALSDYAGRAVYRTRFPFPRREGAIYRLRFHGVFYGADVYLNGNHLGHHEGYFDPFDFRVEDVLEDENLLVVEIACPQEENRGQKRQITGVFGHWDVISFHHNPGGIWLPVEIVETGRAWLDRVQMRVLDLSAEGAHARFNVDLFNLGEPDLDLRFSIIPENFTAAGYEFRRRVRASAGRVRLSEEYGLIKPERWWTHDRGFPHLYRVTVTLARGEEVLDRQSSCLGLRTIAADDRLRFRLNDESLYIKGNNYAPSDVYLSRAVPADLAKDVAMMLEANYNLVRVHAHVDRPEFYDECDRRGLLVWQDFPLQWGYHPSIFAEARRQLGAMIQLLENHPSLALWCCHNEPSEIGLTLHDFRWKDLVRSIPGILRMARGVGWNLRMLDPALAATAEEEDPTRPINPGSGFSGPDKHHYCGWYFPLEGDADRFRRYFREQNVTHLGFLTEFGAQAFPVYENALKFMPDFLPQIDWKKFGRFHLYQDFFMRRYVDRRKIGSLAELCAASQEYQARLLKWHVEWLRSVKYHLNFGVVAFLHNDSHPAVTWSVADYWRSPKPAYAALRDAFSPVWAFATPRFRPYRAGRTARIPLFAANDSLETFRGVAFRAVLRREQQTVDELATELDLLPDMLSQKVGELVFTPPEPGLWQLEISMTKPEAVQVQNRYALQSVGSDLNFKLNSLLHKRTRK